MSTGRPKIVVLGMMTKIPVAGVVWQTVHYLVGFQRLGFDAYYVEAHARTPGMLMRDAGDDSGALAAAFIDDALRAVRSRRTLGVPGAARRRAPLRDERRRAAPSVRVRRADRQPPRRHRAAAGALRDRPARLPRDRPGPAPDRAARGAAVHARLPRAARRLLHLRRELRAARLRAARLRPLPLPADAPAGGHRLLARGRRRTRASTRPSATGASRGATSPTTASATAGARTRSSGSSSTSPRSRAATSSSRSASYTPQDRELLESRGWRVRPALDFSTDLDAYRDYIRGSRGEFTVAKDQNVRLRTGWFSDRGATYLAAGRPVVTQDTGFGDVLPTGEALFPFTTIDEAAAAIETIEADYRRHARRRSTLAREYFDSDVVLGRLLDDGRRVVARSTPAGTGSPDDASISLPCLAAADGLARTHGRGGAQPRRSRRRAATGSAARDHDASVVVVAPDGLAFTRLCLESVLLNADDADVEVVVVDNGYDRRNARVPRRARRARLARASCCATTRTAASGRRSTRASRRPTATCSSCSTTTRWFRPAGCRGSRPISTVPRSGSSARPRTGAATRPRSMRLPHLRRNGPAVSEESGRARGRGVRHRGGDAVLRGDAPRRLRAGRACSTSASRSASSRTTTTPSGCARRATASSAPRTRSSITSARRSFGELVPTGRYGELFRANKARFEEKWGVTWQPHLRRPNAWYRDLVERIRAVVDRELPPDATVLVVSNGDDELLQLGAERRGWHFPQMEDGTYAGYHPGDSAEAIAHFEAPSRARRGVHPLPGDGPLVARVLRGVRGRRCERDYGEIVDAAGTCIVFGRSPVVELSSPASGADSA